jgi:hypothetical protein
MFWSLYCTFRRDEVAVFVREQNNRKAQPWMATIENKNSDLNFSKFVLRELFMAYEVSHDLLNSFPFNFSKLIVEMAIANDVRRFTITRLIQEILTKLADLNCSNREP